MIGSALYLIGSACFLPQINQSDLGVDYFIYGSSFVFVSQSWKLLRSFCQKDKTLKEVWKEDPSGILVDFFAGIGGCGYFTGSFFFFEKIAQYPNLAYQGASFFTLGGICFLISAIFMQKRYYCEAKEEQSEMLVAEK